VAPVRSNNRHAERRPSRLPGWIGGEEPTGRPTKPAGGGWFVAFLVPPLPYTVLAGPLLDRGSRGLFPAHTARPRGDGARRGHAPDLCTRGTAPLPATLPAEVQGDNPRSIRRARPPTVPLRLGRAASCGAAAAQSASCPVAWRTTAIIPRATGVEIRGVGAPSRVKIPLIARNLQGVCVRYRTVPHRTPDPGKHIRRKGPR
jgi:hypothetical protein